MIRTTAFVAASALFAAACVAGAGLAAAQTAPQFQRTQPESPDAARQQFRPAAPRPEDLREAPAEDSRDPHEATEDAYEGAHDPTGSLGGWATDVQADAAEDREATIRRINDYFNALVNLEGRFVQIDPDNKRTRGRFYVQRPGLLRFDYAPPSLLRIVADGRYLSIEDHDLKTIDKYPLDATPFRMLLKPDVDLMRDAHVVSLVQNDDLAVLTIEDRSGDASGRLMLTFDLGAGPDMTMREWVITDPQGLNTRIQLADVVTGKQVDRDFFSAATIGFPSRD